MRLAAVERSARGAPGRPPVTSAIVTRTLRWLRQHPADGRRAVARPRARPTPPGRAAAGTGGGWCGRRSVTSTSALPQRLRAQPRPPNPPPTITIRAGQPTPADLLAGGAEALEQVVADAQRVGHRRQRGVDRADAREEARVDDVEVVDVVRAAVGVEHRRRRAEAEPARPRLVRDARDRDLVLEVGVARDEVVLVHPDALEQRLELGEQPLLGHLVGRLVGELDAPVVAQRDPVLQPRQVLGGEPEVDRVAGDLLQRPLRARAWSAAASRRGTCRPRTCRPSGCSPAGTRSRRTRSRSR